MKNNNFLKLIVENDFHDYEVINEAGENKPRSIKMRGIFIQADKKNANDRVYRYEDIRESVSAFTRDFVNQGRALGELEHPEYAYINPTESAIRITKLTELESDKAWLGEAVVLASDPKHDIIGTPKGDILASLIQHGTKLGYSTRGVGEVNDDGVVENYNLITVDCVANPSIGVFAEGILESKNFIVNQYGEICEVAYQNLEKKLEKLPKLDTNAFIAEQISNFLKKISK